MFASCLCIHMAKNSRALMVMMCILKALSLWQKTFPFWSTIHVCCSVQLMLANREAHTYEVRFRKIARTCRDQEDPPVPVPSELEPFLSTMYMYASASPHAAVGGLYLVGGLYSEGAHFCVGAYMC